MSASVVHHAACRGVSAAHGWLLLSWVGLLLPLGCFALPPCSDLPQHLALSALIWRLLQDDAAVQLYYALQLQPMPYYLLYVLSVPLVGLCGAVLGGKILLAGLALGWLLAGRACLQAIGAAPCWLWVWSLGFWGPNFYYGFVATLLGLPGVFYCLAAALQPPTARQTWRLAAAGALWATLAHALLALPCALLALLTRAIHGRRANPLLLAVGAATVLPLLPQLWRSSQLARVGSAYQWVAATPALQWHYFKTHLAVWHGGVASYAHVGMWLAALGRRCSWPQPPAVCRRQRAQSWLLGTWLAVLLGLASLWPRHISHAGSQVWGIAFRYWAVAEGAAWLLLLRPPRLATDAPRPRARHAWPLLLVGSGLLFSAAQWQVWARFNAAAQPLWQRLQALPLQQALQVKQPGTTALAGSRVPLLNHLSLYYVARGGVCQTDLFTDAHLPVRWRDAQAAQRCAQAARLSWPPR